MDIESLRKDIIEILKNADLSKLSTKKIRLQLEGKYNLNLTDRKAEIDNIVMSEISALERKKEEKKKKNKQSSSNGRPPKRKRHDNEVNSDDEKNDDGEKDRKSSDEDSDGSGKDDKPDKNTEDDEDIARQLQEEEENGAVRRTRHASKRKTSTKAEKKPRKKGAPRENRFTETCNLSPELAAIMGEEKMRRSDVVKKMWAIVKEKNLYDPKNKQYMICDEQMQSVFGKKKVRIFGMMKYLSSHIYKSEEVVDS